MPEPKLQFVAFLSNVDGSITSLKLGDGFRIRHMTEEMGIALISKLEGVGPEMAYERAEAQYACLNRKEHRFYVAMKTYQPSAGQLSAMANDEIPDMTLMLIDTYKLTTKLSLARLYQEGDIRAPLSYGMVIDQMELKRVLKGFATNTILSRVPYVINPEDAENIGEFIRTTELKSFQQYVLTAFRDFEESYSTHSEGQALTSLMAAVESLLHGTYAERVSEEIANNCALLLGTNPEERSSMYSEVKRLYSKRSLILHGKPQVVTKDDIILLRNYVRRAIKELASTGIGKQQLIDSLRSKQGSRAA